MNKKKKAFTLAEVLISLTIIGVVAAITVPALIQRTNKQEYVTALQKAYSTLSQATNMIIAENGSPKGDDGGWGSSTDAFFDMYKKHLSSAKECGSEQGCLRQKLKDINDKGVYKGRTYSFDVFGHCRRLILADGMQIMFNTDNIKTCPNGKCAEIWVDINGEKAPNTMGRDVFAFSVREDGLVPAGCGYSGDECLAQTGWYPGSNCTCKVIREGKMDY